MEVSTQTDVTTKWDHFVATSTQALDTFFPTQSVIGYTHVMSLGLHPSLRTSFTNETKSGTKTETLLGDSEIK